MNIPFMPSESAPIENSMLSERIAKAIEIAEENKGKFAGFLNNK
jgi:hypothetical protein